MDSAIVAVALRKAYETRYQIADHDLPSNQQPLSLVSYRPAESHVEHGLHYAAMRLYVDMGVYQHTGISWTDLIRLPKNEYEQIIKCCLEKNAKVGQVADKALRDALPRQ